MSHVTPGRVSSVGSVGRATVRSRRAVVSDGAISSSKISAASNCACSASAVCDPRREFGVPVTETVGTADRLERLGLGSEQVGHDGRDAVRACAGHEVQHGVIAIANEPAQLVVQLVESRDDHGRRCGLTFRRIGNRHIPQFSSPPPRVRGTSTHAGGGACSRLSHIAGQVTSRSGVSEPTADRAIMSTVSSVEPGAPQRDSVESASRAFLGAFEDLDLDRFMACWGSDPSVIHPFPESGRRLDGWSQVHDGWRAIFDFLRTTKHGPPYLDLRPLDLDVRELGDGVAVVSFHLALDRALGRRTLVLSEQSGAWKVVHLHASNVTAT